MEASLQNTLNEIAEVKTQIEEIKRCLKNLYIDKTKNEITQEMYSELLESVSNDEKKQNKLLENLERKREELMYDIQNKKNKLEIINNYLGCDSLTYEMVQVFIEKIIIHKETGQSRKFKLEIYWNF